MRLLPQKLDLTIGNLGYSKKLNFTLDDAKNYAQVDLRFKNVELDQLGKLVMRLNLDQRINVDASFFVDLEKYKDQFVPIDGELLLTIPFADFKAKTLEGQSFSGLQLLPGDTCTFTVEIGAAKTSQTSAGKTPELNIYTVFGINERNKQGQIVRMLTPKITEEVLEITKTGENSVKYDDLNPAKNQYIPIIKRIHAKLGSNTVEELEIKQKRNGVWISLVEGLDKKHIDHLLRKFGALKPQTGYLHIDPAFTGFAIADSIDTAEGAIDIRPKVTTTDNIIVIMELLERNV